MSEYLSKKAVLEWLESEMSINKGHPDDIDIHWTLNRISKKILSGAFDADDSEAQRLRAVLEDIRYQIQQSDHPAGLGILATINQALSTTTEPTGARREICPDHSDEKPQISSSHTWTQDGNTYFVSYVEYCPTCYHVISTSARL